MKKVFTVIISFLVLSFIQACTGDILGCGGFVKSHVLIDFSKVIVKLYTKNGILKDQTSCAPNSGYYFIPLYEKTEYILKLEPPPGWSFEPTSVSLSVDDITEICSKGNDINFVFKGFGITGKVESLGTEGVGPSHVTVLLQSNTELRTTTTGLGGSFFFTPVYPGNYTVTISHPKWKILKGSVDVMVTEGNTDLGSNSLVIKGYDVNGYVKSSNEYVKDVVFILSKQKDYDGFAEVDGCEKSPDALCQVVSNEQGLFSFPCVTPGKYVITPAMRGQNVHFEPPNVKFEVQHDSVQLTHIFEVVGFSISGKVLDSPGGTPIQDAKIFLDKKQVVVTDVNGSYILEKMKAGKHVISIKTDDYEFEERIFKVNPNMPSLPNFYPTKYRACGVVMDDKSRTVSFTDEQHKFMVSTEAGGEFCIFLPPGKYSMTVELSKDESNAGIQFSVVSDTIEITAKPVHGIVFSQLKATISGAVHCFQDECNGLKVALSSVHKNETITELSKTNEYSFKDIRPGHYRVAIKNSNFCFKNDFVDIYVKDEVTKVPTFEQNGYLVTFLSSHDSRVTYTKQNKTASLDIKKGSHSYCVEHPGSYTFKLDSCHLYPTNEISYDTKDGTKEIILTAKKHRHTALIQSDEKVTDLFISVTISGEKMQQGPLAYNGKYYVLEMFLATDETAVLHPTSEILYFKPPILSIVGDKDCVDLGVVSVGVKGHVFKGKVIPPLSGVTVLLEADKEVLMTETDDTGSYKFAPQDNSKTYTVTAKKDAFVLTGPDENGNFLAHKLAELVVHVVDSDTGLPLQGTLLSLSGPESYRSNLQTNKDGKIIFSSLSPSEYYLKPMMKEYSFEPSSKIVQIHEGVSTPIFLKGKRVAYSAFGNVRSLNGDSENDLSVVAAGLGNCSQLSEETTVEESGRFRVRGLQPHCSYDITIQHGPHIERVIPSSVKINDVTEDIYQVEFIIFRQMRLGVLMVKIYAEEPDHYKSLRVKISRESSPSTVIHNIKLENSYKVTRDTNYGIVLQVPSIPIDSKIYSVQLESNLPQPSLSSGRYFISNSTFNYIEVEYILKTGSVEQHVKQTPVWTIVFTILFICVIYNIDIIYALLKDRLAKTNSGTVLSRLKQKSPSTDVQLDQGDIDLIVQSINAIKRKPKPKKI